MSRRTKTTLPIAQQLLEPEVPPDVKKKLILKRRKAKKYFDKGAKELPELVIGKSVRVKPVVKKSKIWQRGDCVGKVGPRSYLIDIDGRIVRRNRRVIREAKDPVPPSYLMSMNNLPEAPSSHCESEHSVCRQPVVDQPVVASNTQSNLKHGEANLRTEITSNQPNAKQAEISKPQRTESKTRSGRTVRKPEKLNL